MASTLQRRIPLQTMGVYLVVVANVMIWVSLVVLDRPRPHTEDVFFIYGLLAGMLATLGITFNVAGLITAWRQKTPKSPAMLWIVIGFLSIISIVLVIGYRGVQTVFMPK